MSKGKNPFFDDDDDVVDDDEFLKYRPQGDSGYILRNNTMSPSNSDYELRQKMLQEERRRIEDRTLQSAQTSLHYIHESEQVGIATAEELVRQHEQLDNVEKNLDIINNSMRISQKHINSIKSVFGGIKSFFKGSSAPDSGQNNPFTSPTEPKVSGLQSTVGALRESQVNYSNPHPALRVRGIDYDEVDDDDFVKVNRSEANAPAKTNAKSFDDKLDENLEDMSMGLGRLKNLAIGLQTEIEDQNETLDRLYSKTDNAEGTLEYQNRQIKRILKK